MNSRNKFQSDSKESQNYQKKVTNKNIFFCKNRQSRPAENPKSNKMYSDGVRWLLWPIQQSDDPQHNCVDRHRRSITTMNSQPYKQHRDRDSLLKLFFSKLIVMWLVINMNVNVVLSDAPLNLTFNAIQTNATATNATSAAKAIATHYSTQSNNLINLNNNNTIDNDDQPIMIVYDEYYDVDENDNSVDDKKMPSTNGHFTSTWAVHIPGGDAEAGRVADELGFQNLGKVCTTDTQQSFS